MRIVAFSSVNLLGIYRNNIPLAARIFEVVMRLVHQGVTKAVHPVTIFNYFQLESAFRFMQTGKHLGKIVLKPHDEDLVPVSPFGDTTAELTRSIFFLRIRDFFTLIAMPSCLLVGGLGRSVARWMM